MSPVKRVVKDGAAVALTLLRVTQASSDVFPPLKSAVNIVLSIADNVMVRSCCLRPPYPQPLILPHRNSNQTKKAGLISVSMSEKCWHV